mmetsp:Transcript_26235/g.60330  ORF Transcript_26235/g.60330 Transcript_26235/m.60330 type:complete len:282 (-) Transcript_26235:66-911(-)
MSGFNSCENMDSNQHEMKNADDISLLQNSFLVDHSVLSQLPTSIQAEVVAAYGIDPKYVGHKKNKKKTVTEMLKNINGRHRSRKDNKNEVGNMRNKELLSQCLGEEAMESFVNVVEIADDSSCESIQTKEKQASLKGKTLAELNFRPVHSSTSENKDHFDTVKISSQHHGSDTFSSLPSSFEVIANPDGELRQEDSEKLDLLPEGEGAEEDHCVLAEDILSPQLYQLDQHGVDVSVLSQLPASIRSEIRASYASGSTALREKKEFPKKRSNIFRWLSQSDK